MTQDEALDILKTGANVFLTGEPGSGKTHTVNRYVSYLREHGVRPSVTASTGIAATHIGGMTIHSWSGIGIRPYLTAHDLNRLADNSRIVKRLNNSRVLIIDEVSMLAAGTLAMVDTVCRTLREDQKPFGGLQVIMVGDFFQLPPVVVRVAQEQQEPDLFNDDAPHPQALFAFMSPLWDALGFETCYLTEQHRQEDDAYLSILGAIRSGEITEDHLSLLNARHTQKPKDGVTRLFSHNADVDRINEAELAKLPADLHKFEMDGRGPVALLMHLKKGCLSPETLKLKTRARVMFTKNNFEAGYVNGTLGTVTGFSQENGYPVVETRKGRAIHTAPVEWTIEDGGKALARIEQVPLRLAWAMTVHKSQGMSLDEAHVDLSNAFEYGQGYVALSRVRSLSGLSLGGLNGRALEVHPEIRVRDDAFRNASRAARNALRAASPHERAKSHDAFLYACGGKPLTAKPQLSQAGKIASSVVSGLDSIRKSHANAYMPWSQNEDNDLRQRHAAGERIGEIAAAMGRQRGAITSRLAKLGLF